MKKMILVVVFLAAICCPLAEAGKPVLKKCFAGYTLMDTSVLKAVWQRSLFSTDHAWQLTVWVGTRGAGCHPVYWELKWWWLAAMLALIVMFSIFVGAHREKDTQPEGRNTP